MINDLGGIAAPDLTPYATHAQVDAGDAATLAAAQAYADTTVLGLITSEATARVAADDAHVAATDPHPQYTTAAEVDARVQQVIGTAPAALDTLGEIAAQLASDESAVAALTTTVASKVSNTDPRLTDARTPTTHTHPASEVSDSTTTGRSLLTAADAAAARPAIGLTGLTAPHATDDAWPATLPGTAG